MNKHQTITLTIFLLLILCLAACRDGKPLQNNDKRQQVVDSLNATLREEASGNPGHALSLIDSMEHQQLISHAYADCRRAQVYAEQYQPRVAEIYASRALKDDELFRENASTYYFAHNLLINSALNASNPEKALTYASAARSKAMAHGDDMGREYAPDFLTCIGNCQFMLGRLQAGNASMNKAYQEYQQLLGNNTQFASLYPMYMLTIDAINHHLNNDSTATALSWVPRMNDAYQRVVGAKDIPSHAEDNLRAENELTQAKVYAKAGQLKAAQQHYAAFSRTAFGQSAIGKKEAQQYLETIGDWHQLLKSLEVADSFFVANNPTPNMDYVRSTLGTKYTTQLRLGMRDEALLTASTLVGLLDTVADQTDRENATELSIIYETQEKEAKIAEQEVSIARHRTISVAVGMLLVVVFLLLFMVHRHHAAKKLEEKNQELLDKNRQLTAANARAEESSRMKTNFIHQISHEIRTPLNILSGFTQVLTTPGFKLDDATRQDINQRIAENTDRITSMIDKMLELSESNSTAVIPRTDDVAVMQIATQAATDSGIDRSAAFAFTIHASAEVSQTTLHTNLVYATRALTQLLDNARKFTRQGSVDLTLTLQSPAFFAFVVEDTGIGIPQNEADRIFDEFVQLDEYTDGTGIGLTVARSIARRLGGDIVLDTAHHPGSRFVMTLPV